MKKFYSTLVVVVSTLFLTGITLSQMGCSTDTETEGECFGVFAGSAEFSKKTLEGSTYNVIIKDQTTVIYFIALGGYNVTEPDHDINRNDPEIFDPYEGTSWKLIDDHGTFPDFIYVTIDPLVLARTEGYTKLTIETKKELRNGKYQLKVEANRADFNKPRHFYVDITVDIPTIDPPSISPVYEYETLLIAPGEQKTNVITINGIKNGQSFTISNTTTNSDHLKNEWITQSSTVFTPTQNTSTFSVTIPDETLPNINEEMVWLHPIYVNTNEPIEFAEDKKGFRVSIAGFNVRSDRGSYTMNFGETLTIPVSYVINGNGTFTPELIPPSSFPSNNVVITKDVTSSTGKSQVDVNYTITFKEKPTTNLTFDISGTISYGKEVHIPVVIIVQ